MQIRVIAATALFALAVVACGSDGPAVVGGDMSNDGGQGIAPGEWSHEFDSLLGLPVADAGALAAEGGLAWRIVREDGEDLMITMDYREDRVNFTVQDGIVIDARSDADLGTTGTGN